MITTTEGKLYLLNVNKPSERVEIQFVPMEIKAPREIELAEIKVVGRNIPQYHYVGGAKKIQMELDFYAQDDDRKDVLRKVAMIESWTYNDGFRKPPPPVKLIFGSMFRAEKWVITKFIPRYSNFNKPSGYLPCQAYVDIELSLDLPNNPKVSDIQWQ